VLREAGIAFEVVPGVTAGVAAPAYAGVPVTQRGMASASPSSPGTRIRPRGRRRSTGPRWPVFPGTLVFYMGVRALPRIAEQLVAEGRGAEEPVAVVERGTMPGQRAVHGNAVQDIAERAAEAGVPAALDHGRRARRRAGR